MAINNVSLTGMGTPQTSGGDWFSQNSPSGGGLFGRSLPQYPDMPQLDPNITATTPIVGDTIYSENGQRIDPNDPRIVAYNQQMQQWGLAHPEAAPPGSFMPAGGVSVQPGQFNPSGGIMKPGGSVSPSFTAGMTPDQVRQAVTQYYASRGVTPNPTSVDYWTQKWGEFGNSDPAYFSQRLSQADEFGGGGGMSGGGSLGGSLGSFGSLINHLPTGQDAQNMPGIQFAIDRAQNAQQHSAAARGTLLSGGALKDLADYTTGAALQGYGQLANLQLGYNQANVGNLYNLANLGLSGSSVGSQ